MNELQAYFTLLAEERDRIAHIPALEHRQHSDAELERLVHLDAALTALVNADRRRSPPQPPAPTPATPASLPTAAAPGSDYRLVADKQHGVLHEQFKFSMAMSAEFGKWLVATISAVLLGGIFFVGSLPGVTLDAKEPALWALAIGVILNLASGFVAYWNWGANARLVLAWMNPDMLVLPEKWPRADPAQMAKVRLTFLLAITLGVLSVLTIPAAGILLSIYA